MCVTSSTLTCPVTSRNMFIALVVPAVWATWVGVGDDGRCCCLCHGFFLFFFLRSPAISLGFTTLGEIFAYVTVF